jgi:hypothetical protein
MNSIRPPFATSKANPIPVAVAKNDIYENLPFGADFFGAMGNNPYSFYTRKFPFIFFLAFLFGFVR